MSDRGWVVTSTDGTKIECSICGKECGSVFKGDAGMYLCNEHKDFRSYNL